MYLDGTIKQKSTLLVTMLFFTYAINESVRMFMLSFLGIRSGFIAQINIVAYLLFVGVLFKELRFTKVKLSYLLIFSVMLCILLISNLYSGDISNLASVIYTLFPLLLLTMNDMDNIDSERGLRYLYRLLFAISIIMIFTTLLDYYTGIISRLMIYLLSKTYTLETSSLLRTIITYVNASKFRCNTFWGQALNSCKYFLTFYLLHCILKTKGISRYYIKEILVIIITAIGVVLAGSKSGLVILGAMILVYYLRKDNIKYLLPIAIISIVIMQSELFNIYIGYRFETIDLSSGRNDLIRLILSGTIDPPGLWGGGGASFSRSILLPFGATVNFEYPFIMFAYDYGLIFAILFELMLFVPVFYLTKHKAYRKATIVFLYIVYLNVFNGLSSKGDAVLQFSLLMALVMFYEAKNIHVQPIITI